MYSTTGVLLNLEPVVAALMGFIVLRETLELKAIAAIVLITVAAAGASQFGRSEKIVFGVLDLSRI